MNARRVLLFLAVALSTLDAAASRAAQQPGTMSLRQYLAAATTVTDSDLAALERGRPIAKALPTKNGAEVYVLGVIHVRANAEAYVTRALDPSRLMAMPGYRGTGIISDQPTVAEFERFTLEPNDVEKLQDCEPGDCAVQLPAAIIPDLRTAASHPTPTTAAILANNGMRQLALDIVRQYRERGNAALPTFNDEERPAVVAEHFASLMQRVMSLSVAPVEVERYMMDYPNPNAGPPGVGSVFYWEKVAFGLKPTLRVVHAMSYRPQAPGPLGCVVAIKQLYATHYLRAAIDFTTCLEAPARDGQPGFYLVAVKGSRQEGVTGLTGSLVRRIVVSRARTALEGSLVRIKNAMEKT